MKKDVLIRTSVAVALLVTTTAVAQNAQVPPQDVQPAPGALAPVQPPASVAPTVPQSPPPLRYPVQPQNQTPPPAPSPPPRQYPSQPAQPTYARPDWMHSESTYADNDLAFHYHPFRFHVDGGGTITQQSNDATLDNGWNVGAGLTWYPTSVLPLGIRVDGTYNHFDGRGALLQQASAYYGTHVDDATQRIWGGDVDLELDLHFSPYVQGYILAGGGWYRRQTTYRQINYSSGVVCDWWGCGPGYVGMSSIVARNQTNWQFAKNAGLGLEFAMAPHVSFFVEARYMRINPNNAKDDFLPIRAGLRF